MRPFRWPSQCAVCRDWAHARVCEACIERFAPPVARCHRCALPSPTPVCGECLCAPPPFESALTAVDYAYPWDGLVTALKFHQGLDLAPALAALMAAMVRQAPMALPSFVLPVPLARERLRERGYNQAWELARRVARALRCEADATRLVRIADTPHQTSLPRERRVANVRGSFAVDGAHRLRGRAVALVDDVMTTGATAREAAQTLLDAGAGSVRVWVAARTPRPTIG